MSANQDHLALLKKAALEIEATGKLSEELKGRIFGDAERAELWKWAEEQLFEGVARGIGVTVPFLKHARDLDPDSAYNLLLGTAEAAALMLVRDKGSKVVRSRVSGKC